MALRTNSKVAINNIRKYIVDHFDGTNYDIETPEGFPATAAVILSIFRDEYLHGYNMRYPERVNFREWCAGLPSILDTCYYYNRSAVDDLGAILEETETEKARYSESDAAQLLTSLIYRELLKGEEIARKEGAKCF